MTNGWPEKIHPAFDGFESSKLLGGFSMQRFRVGQSFGSENKTHEILQCEPGRHLQKVAFR